MRVSEYYNLGLNQGYLDFVDVPLDTDIPVFVDPSAIRNLNSIWGAECISLLQNFFTCVLGHLRDGNVIEARKLFSNLNERNEFHLGLSTGESKGHAIGEKYARLMLSAIQNSPASTTGLLEDLEDTCLLIRGVGPDLISDAICNIIRGPLIKYTQDVCNFYDIPIQPGVVSGMMWEGTTESWTESFVDLPIVDESPLLLVPRSIVRIRFSFNAQRYYRHYLLPEMQRFELNANTALVRILKDGSRKPPTKKRLMEIHGSGKNAIIQQTERFQETFARYKREARIRVDEIVSDAELESLSGTNFSINWDDLITELNNIGMGEELATKYHKHVEKIFVALFFPHLLNPYKEYKLHDGRKRVDIRITNESRRGFFHWLGQHYPAQYIWIECKNYSGEVSNPEVDQLSGRFSPSRGQFGFLVCRNINNKQRLKDRCRDTAKDGRGYVIALDDNDLKHLIQYAKENREAGDFPSLRESFDYLIN